MKTLSIALERTNHPHYLIAENLYVKESNMNKILTSSKERNQYTTDEFYMIPYNVNAYIITERIVYEIGSYFSLDLIQNGKVQNIYEEYVPSDEPGKKECYKRFIEKIHPILDKYVWI